MSENKKRILEASDVSIVFGGLRAVSGFECELYEGELAGQIGANGAVKTTMYNMIGGINTTTRGKIMC